MYSKAQIAGHPIHPMMIAFPIAFYTAAFAAYLYYSSGSRSVFWFELAYIANIAGVLSALVASIPGFIDWAFGIPKDHPAKKTGLAHFILNGAAILFFAMSWAYNSAEIDSTLPSAGVAVFLCAFGLACTFGAGVLGFKMVSTHHIGIEATSEQERVDAADAAYGTPGLRAERRDRTDYEDRRDVR